MACTVPATVGRWTSDDADECALAAELCGGCPVIELCESYAMADGQQFGVWAGRDRGIK